MIARKTLSSIFQIQPGEGLPVALMALHSFFMGISLVFIGSCASALFLAEFDASILPYVYIFIAFFISITGLFYTKLEQWLSFSTLLTVNLVFNIALLFLFRFFLSLSLPIGVLLYFWWYAMDILLNLEFWGLAGRLFNIRQGKRFFGFLGSPELLATTIGGLSIPWIVPLFGTSNLLFICAFSNIACLIILLYIVKKFPDKLSPVAQQAIHKKGKKIQTAWDLFKNPYSRWIFVFSSLCWLVYYFVDNLFYERAGAQFKSQEELASFFGNFFALMGTIAFLVRFFLADRLISRYGLSFALLTTPILVLYGGICIVISGNIMGSVPLIFWLTSGTRLLEASTRRSLHRSARGILYQAIPAELRLKAQTITESVVDQMAAAVAGIILLILTACFSSPLLPIAYFLIILCFVWIFVSILLHQEYKAFLTKEFLKRNIQEFFLSVNDKCSVALLQNALKSNHPGEVIYALNMIEENNPQSLEKHLLPLLSHPEAQVRGDCLQRIERMNLSSLLEHVSRLIRVESSFVVKGIALRTLASLGGSGVLDEILPYLEQENMEIKKGAMVGLLKSGGIQGVLFSGMDLLKKVSSENSIDRICAAKVLGEVGIQDFYQPLLQLLQDKDPLVRQQALLSAGKLKNAKLWPLVIENLKLPVSREFALNALVSGGKNTLQELAAAIDQDTSSNEMKYWIVRALGQIKGEKAIQILLSHFNMEDKNIFSQMLLALSLCGYHEPGNTQEPSLMKSRLKQESCDASFLLVHLKAFENVSWGTLLITALENEFKQAQRRIFYLLSFLYDSHVVLEACENLYHPLSERRAYAMEILDNLLSLEIKSFVFPLLDNLTLEKRINALIKEFPHADMTQERRLQEVSRQAETWCCYWLQACAIYSMAQAKEKENLDYILSYVHHSNALVRETAIWACFQLAGESWEKEVAWNDSSIKEWIVDIKANIHREVSLFLTIAKVQFLKKISIFSEIPEESLSKIVPYFQLLQVNAGNLIFQEGDPGESLYIIIQGQVRVYNTKGTIATLGQNEVFGEFSLWDSQPRSASVISESDTKLIYLDKNTFDSIIIERPEILKSIIKVLCRRLRQHIPHLLKKSEELSQEEEKEKENLLPLEKVLFLKTIPFFSAIPDKNLEEILSITKEEKYERGEIIISQGSIVKYMYVILSGQVSFQNGQEIFGYGESGEIFGELFLFDFEPISASIKAEKNTHVLAIERESFCEMMEDRIEIAKGIIYSLIQRHRSILARRD